MDRKILNNYLNEIQLEENDVQYLSEDIKSMVNKLKSLNIKKIATSLQNAVKSKDLNKIKTVVKSIKLPNVSMDKIKQHFKKSMPQFDKSYKLSQKVMKNSIPKLPDKNVDIISTVVAAKSNFQSKDPMGDTRKNLVQAVSHVRKYIGEGTNYEGGNLGNVIYIIFIIGSIIAASVSSVSIPVLVITGLFLFACKQIFE